MAAVGAKAMNLIDVSVQFATDEQCLDYLEQTRWPEGVRCPTCGNDKISRIERQSKTKNKRTRIYQCLESSCKQQFTATAGTIFNDSHLPLRKWFMAVALITDAKKGMSAKQLQRHLKVNYRTAWHLAHRIREAMTEPDGVPLTGTVEIDETYVGGKTRNRDGSGRSIRYKNKDAVIGMIERGGKLRFRHLCKGAPNSKLIREIISAELSSSVERIVTDESALYPLALEGINAKHDAICHKYEYVRGDVHTNTIESAFSLLKRGIVGSFHQVSIKHLHRYLSEFEFRFNRRDDGDLFEQTLRRMSTVGALRYTELTGREAELSSQASAGPF
jgi:transposase-like protein